MGDFLTINTFEEWVAYIFNHPVSEPAWYWDLNAPSWNEEDHNDQVVEYMTALFENAAVVLEPFSNAQLNQGFWLLASNTGSNHMFALLDESVPWPHRKRCIQAMEQLFRQCFAQRCSPHVSQGHIGDDSEIDVLNSVCYMWFDIIPIHGKPNEIERRQVDDAFMDMIERLLDIEHVACRESVLYGVYLWELYYPDRIASAFKRFERREA